MLLTRELYFSLLRRWFFYELIFLAGLGAAGFFLKLYHINPLALYDFLNIFLLGTTSFLLVSLFAVELRKRGTLTSELTVCIFAAFLSAGLANFQAALVVGVILSTTFLYECHPFCLRRWKAFFAVKYALDATALFVLGLFILWQRVGSYFFILFFTFYIVLQLARKVVYLSKRPNP